MKNNIKNNNIFNYFCVLILLLIDDSPFFLDFGPYLHFVVMVFLILIAYIKRKLVDLSKIIIVLFLVWGLVIIQWVFYGGISPAGLYKPLLFFLTPFLIYRIMGLSYFRYLFNIIYFFAIFTFPIYLLQSLFQPVNLLVTNAMKFVFPYVWTDWPRTLLFYSMPRESGYLLMRNSGIYHEPGAYSIYLMLAIIINTYLTRKPLGKKNIILAIILLTTFSTTGYILLLIFLLYAFLSSNSHISIKYFSLIFLIIFAIQAFRSAEFLGEKIIDQVTYQSYAIESNKVAQGRFFAFLKGYQLLKENPVFGKGIIMANTPISADFNSSAFGWGFMGFFVKYGILFGFFYMWIFYKGLRELCAFYNLPKFFSIIFYLIMHAALLTQSFFFHTAFVMIFIVGLEFDIKTRDKSLVQP